MTSRHRPSRRSIPLRRRLGLEHNTLRRPADHVESSIIVTLLSVFLIGAPLLGFAVGRTSYDTGLRVERAHEVTQPVTARLTADAPTPAPAVDVAPPSTVPVRARWTYAGVAHAGTIRVQPGVKAGTEVTVWVDARGTVVTEHRTHLETVERAVAKAGASVGALAIVCWLGAVLTRRIFIHRQLAAWDADWSVAEPRWSGRTGS
ncbi:MAG TPA: hypothetical protein VFU43_28770 [Streptosporangiaceae bacterium]|nr:hypothetical protein [Streptosporangiaceae bacterium]